MYYKEHVPLHFHAKYDWQRNAFSINDLKLIESIPLKRIVSLFLEWTFEHRDELMANLELAKGTEKGNRKGDGSVFFNGSGKGDGFVFCGISNSKIKKDVYKDWISNHSFKIQADSY